MVNSDFSRLEKMIGYAFASPEFVVQAMKHSSYVNEVSEDAALANERLEFFGDAIVGLVITERLYHAFPGFSEGRLSIIKSRLVSGSRLAAFARQLGLGEFILLGKGEERLGGREKESILSSAFEALVAAIYLDGGIDPAKRFIDTVFEHELKNAGDSDEQLDYKSRLQKWTQKKYGLIPSYVVTAETGPDHRKMFRVEVQVGEFPAVSASGKSKKDAEQEAARKLLIQAEKR